MAGNLVGKLLLIHGDIDDNVPMTESMRLANAPITKGRDVDVVILLNTTGSVIQPFFWRKLRNSCRQFRLLPNLSASTKRVHMSGPETRGRALHVYAEALRSDVSDNLDEHRAMCRYIERVPLRINHAASPQIAHSFQA